MARVKKVKKLPLSKISLAYRDDIVLRIYYIMTGDSDAIDLWAKINKGRKRHSYGTGYINKIYKWIKKDGRVKKPVYFRARKGKYYTTGGTRLASAYVIGSKTIVGTLGNENVFKNFTISSKKFKGMSKLIIDRLKMRRKIHDGLPILEYSIPELAFMGRKKSKKIPFNVIQKIWSDVKGVPKNFLLEYKKLNE